MKTAKKAQGGSAAKRSRKLKLSKDTLKDLAPSTRTAKELKAGRKCIHTGSNCPG
jgi:hypothetical protein